MKHISLFSGIGGFDLASEWMGWQNVASCEINPFGNKVLQYYWPQAYHHDDIKTLTYEKLNQELTTRFGADWRSDDIILTGGFPCQPYSAAGKRLGKEDERHLWPEMCRIIREVKPTWIVGENVLGLVNWSGGLVFEEVQADLEAEGYEVQPFVLPACAVNAPHRRDRVWFVAKNTRSNRCLCRQSIQKGADIREQRNIGARDTKRIRGEEMAGAAPDTDRLRHRGRYCQSKSNQQSEWKVDFNKKRYRYGVWRKVKGCCFIATDTELKGFSKSTRTGKARGKKKFVGRKRDKSSTFTSTGNPQWNAPDTDNKRLERPTSQRIQTNERGRMRVQNAIFTWMGHSTNWENFPTQSPICTGDDGLSAKLDGITFSKWRNESIKAAGNAIVPQVVYQIFKSIEQYEQNRNHGQDRKAAN